jgi:preprotein translocase subunit YajC
MDALLPLAVLVLAFYLLVLRPMQRRQRDQAAVANALVPGARVVTHSGLHAEVVAVSDTTVDLSPAPGVVTTWAKGAVARVFTDDAHDADDVLDGSHEAIADEPGSAPDPDTDRP